jgi:hypothetical protein
MPANPKPVGGKAYGSIPHLPNSRLGSGDHHIDPGSASLLTERVRDRHDRVIVREKLDGSCVAIARVNNELLPLSRAGYHARTSPYEQHHVFADWLDINRAWFEFLDEGERIAGEWLALAHGTLYGGLTNHTVFVAFDILRGKARATHDELTRRAAHLAQPATLHDANAALPINRALELLGEHGHHGATESVEGIVYRLERHGNVEFLAKYVHTFKQDGKYFAEFTGRDIWNYRPHSAADAHAPAA